VVVCCGVKGGGFRGETRMPVYYVVIVKTVEIEIGKFDSSNF
jgi:hypothetical protein